MKKVFFVFAALILFCSSSFSADNTSRRPVKTFQKSKKTILGQFTKGSIVDGTKSTGSVRRWYIFNEGVLGSSYTMLGKSEYVSADIGYSTYIRSIESLFGGMSLMAGTEISMPIYLMTKGKSNILSDHRDLETKEVDGVAGYGIQLPFMAGLEYKGFYINGLVGYTWLFMKDTYFAQTGPNPTVSTYYDGLIYGGGLGYKISNVVNIGLRYVRGTLTNRNSQTRFDDSALANGLESLSLTRERGKDIYGIEYQRFYAFISVIF